MVSSTGAEVVGDGRTGALVAMKGDGVGDSVVDPSVGA